MRRGSPQTRRAYQVTRVILLAAAAIVMLGGCLAIGEQIRGEQFRYDPYVGRSFAEENEPAEVSSLSDTELVLQGYEKIGSLELRYDLYKAYEDGTRDDFAHEKTAVELLCERAAEVGGQLISVRIEETEQQAATQKQGECLRGHMAASGGGHYKTEYYYDSAGNYMRREVWVPDPQQWVCDEYEYISGTSYYTISWAEVWRKKE